MPLSYGVIVTETELFGKEKSTETGSFRICSESIT